MDNIMEYESEAYDDDSLVYDDEFDEDMYSYDNSPLREGVAYQEVLEHCVQPVLASALNQVWFPLFMCLTFRLIIRLFPIPTNYCHLLSLICGLGCLAHLLGYHAIITVVIGGLTYWFTKYSVKHPYHYVFRGIMYTSLVYLVVREYTGIKLTTESWEEVRGIQMIMFLKTISLSYDLVTHVYTGDSIPTRLQHLGYIYCPATFLFGPWVSYSAYLSIFDRRKPVVREVLTLVPRLLLYAFLSLAFSSCGVYWVFLGFNSAWTGMVRDAMSVRFSHYFICFLSEAMCVICGFTCDNGKSPIEVVDVLKIEFPRSLSEVVVSWNKPMHLWLKKHAYLPVLHLGASKAVLITFLVSAMLHGLNFQLSCVLLSLGLYCFVEHSLREQLATIFNACIKSRRCPLNCEHQYKAGNPLVMLTNFVLSCVAYFHLSYLGIMMDTNTDIEKSVGLIATILEHLSRWNALSYSSHLLIAFTALALYVI